MQIAPAAGRKCPPNGLGALLGALQARSSVIMRMGNAVDPQQDAFSSVAYRSPAIGCGNPYCEGAMPIEQLPEDHGIRLSTLLGAETSLLCKMEKGGSFR
jgi:hypothetical protein